MENNLPTIIFQKEEDKHGNEVMVIKEIIKPVPIKDDEEKDIEINLHERAKQLMEELNEIMLKIKE